MLGLVLTTCGQLEKAVVAMTMLPAESDGEEYICKMYFSSTSDSNGGKVYFLEENTFVKTLILFEMQYDVMY